MFGVDIRSTDTCYTTEEDWSRVRSPSRAERRRRRGFRQNITMTHKPAAVQIGNVIYAHPAIYHEILKRTKRVATI